MTRRTSYENGGGKRPSQFLAAGGHQGASNAPYVPERQGSVLKNKKEMASRADGTQLGEVEKIYEQAESASSAAKSGTLNQGAVKSTGLLTEPMVKNGSNSMAGSSKDNKQGDPLHGTISSAQNDKIQVLSLSLPFQASNRNYKIQTGNPYPSNGSNRSPAGHPSLRITSLKESSAQSHGSTPASSQQPAVLSKRTSERGRPSQPAGR
jgi:hypothetical protein